MISPREQNAARPIAKSNRHNGHTWLEPRGGETRVTKMNSNTLHVIPAGDCWAVDWSNTSEAREIQNLFGTTLLPTAFMRMADGRTVASHIQRFNPHYTVALHDGGASCQ